MAKDFFDAIFGKHGFYTTNNGSVISLNTDSSETDFKNLIAQACDGEYSVYAERMIGENSFATLIGNGKTVNISYVPSEKTVRIVSEPMQYLPANEEVCDCKTAVIPFVSQRRCYNLKNNAGMAYVIRLCDGRFILIDGGYDEYGAAESLVKFLEEQNTVYEKPIVAAVFITHSHNDHLGVITRILKDFSERVILGDFIYNWPDPSLCIMNSDCAHDDFDSLIKGTAQVRTVYARTGQRFCYADATFDILMCPDEFYPETIDKFNDSSLVMKMNLNGHEVLWLGDSGNKSTEKLLKRYNAEVLKCEVLQVSHHGYGGGSPELDSLADPSILLWPAPNYWYRIVKKWSHNSFLVESEKIERVYVSGKGSIIIDFSKDSLPILSEAIKENNSSDLLHNISELTAIMAKRSGLVGVDLLPCKDGYILKPESKGTALIELITPDKMQGVTSFKLSIAGKKTEDEAQFGVAFNIPSPTVWNGENFLNFITDSEEFRVDFYVRGDKKEAYAEINGIATPVRYDSNIESGLYLALKQGSVQLKYAELKVLDTENGQA